MSKHVRYIQNEGIEFRNSFNEIIGVYRPEEDVNELIKKIKISYRNGELNNKEYFAICRVLEEKGIELESDERVILLRDECKFIEDLITGNAPKDIQRRFRKDLEEI